MIIITYLRTLMVYAFQFNIKNFPAQSVEAVEYNNCIFADG